MYYDFYCKWSKHIGKASAYTAWMTLVQFVYFFPLPLTADFCSRTTKKRVITAWRSEIRSGSLLQKIATKSADGSRDRKSTSKPTRRRRRACLTSALCKREASLHRGRALLRHVVNSPWDAGGTWQRQRVNPFMLYCRTLCYCIIEPSYSDSQPLHFGAAYSSGVCVCVRACGHLYRFVCIA
jgi:hypothetical protein